MIDQTSNRNGKLAMFLIAFFSVVLGYMLLLTVDSTGYWYDELWSLDAVGGSVARMLGMLQEDFHPPGYHLALYAWVRVFGTHESAARALSMLFLVATLPATYFLGRALRLSEAASILGAGAACFVNISFGFGLEARAYTMLLFLTTLTLLFMARAGRNPGSYVAAVVAGVFALYSHYAALFILVPAAFLFAAQERNRRFFWLAFIWIFSLTPWVFRILSQAEHFKQIGWLKPPTLASAAGDLKIAFGVQAAPWLLLGFGLVLLIETLRRGEPSKRLWLFLPPLVLLGTAFLSYLVLPIFHPRYLLPTVPMAGLAAGFLVDGFRPKSLRWTLAIAIPTILAFLTLSSWKSVTVKGEDWRGISEVVISRKMDAAHIVTTERSRFFKHYIPDIVILPEEDRKVVEEWLISQGNARIWFLQARQFPDTPATRAVANGSDVLTSTNRAEARALLLQLTP